MAEKRRGWCWWRAPGLFVWVGAFEELPIRQFRVIDLVYAFLWRGEYAGCGTLVLRG